MLADFDNRIYWVEASERFNLGTLFSGGGATFYSISLLLSGDWYHIFYFMAYAFKGFSSACFLSAAWKARKIENFEAKELADKAVVLVVATIFSEIFMVGLTTFDNPVSKNPVSKYDQAALGIFLNCLIFGSACTNVYNRLTLDYEPIPYN